MSIQRQLLTTLGIFGVDLSWFIMTYVNYDPKPEEHDPSLSQKATIYCKPHSEKKVEHIILLFAMHFWCIPHFLTDPNHISPFNPMKSLWLMVVFFVIIKCLEDLEVQFQLWKNTYGS